jgi:hypothetical protein
VYDIVALEMADADKGKRILGEWQQIQIGSGTLTDYARTDVYVDFLFIIGYTGVLVMVSALLRRRHNRSWLRAILAGCLPMAVLAGLLDVAENVLLLRNMPVNAVPDSFISTRYIAGLKFALIGLVLLCWLLSVLAKLAKPKDHSVPVKR